ncbi:MAG: acyl-CoA thioesterase [Lachnospiraceae bacterium]|nr:acyl-CoA thioesterase [Lachnospiraceae bacterium]
MSIYTHRIQYYETDRMGITHHSNYIRFMEEARVEFLKEIGFDYAKLEEEGIVSPVTEVECSFKKTTTFGDLLQIEVRVEEITGVRFRFSYHMQKEDGTFVAEGHSGHCFLNEKGFPIRINRDYPEFYETLSQLKNTRD